MKKEKLILELILSIILMSELLCSIISNMFGIASNVNLFILIIVTILIILYFFNTKSKLTLRLNTGKIIFLLDILLLYFITIVRYGNTHYSVVLFLFFFLIPFLISSHELNSERVLFYCMLLSLLSIFVFNDLFVSQFNGLNQMSMGNAYALCVSVVAGILHFSFFYKKRYIWLYIFQLIVLIKLITLANRGVILEIVFTIILVKLSLYGREETKRKLTFCYVMKCLIISILCLMVVLNLNQIFDLTYKLFNNVLNINVVFLKKISLLLENDDLSNGRLDIYKTAFELIKLNPFFGYGIRSFGIITNESWPHNIFIQFLFEGGIVFGIYPILILIKNIINIFKQKYNKNAFVMMILLFVMIIPRFLLSNDIWLIPYVWLFFGYAFNANIVNDN